MNNTLRSEGRGIVPDCPCHPAPTRTIHELVLEHVERIIRADNERLEIECAQAMALQRFDMLDRLEIVELDNYDLAIRVRSIASRVSPA